MKGQLWVLLADYNDYDQHGSYFVAAFSQKPTVAQLLAIFKNTELARHVLNGGGRLDAEYCWYTLQAVNEGEAEGSHI